MKNLVLAVGVSVLALAGCDNNANAQAQQVSADVGSPQGNNTLIIEEGYTVVDPVQPVQPSGAVDVNNQMQPLPGDREWMLPRCRKEISLSHRRMREMPF